MPKIENFYLIARLPTLLRKEEGVQKQTEQGKGSSLVLLEGPNLGFGMVIYMAPLQPIATSLELCKFAKIIVREVVIGL